MKKSNFVTVMPLTSNLKNQNSDDIAIEPDGLNNLHSASVIKVYNIVSCDYQRITGKIGDVSDKIMDKVSEYLKKHFGI